MQSSYMNEEDFDEEEVHEVENTPKQSVLKNKKTVSFRSAISEIKNRNIANMEHKIDNDAKQKYYQYKLEAAKRKDALEISLLQSNIEAAKAKSALEITLLQLNIEKMKNEM